MNLTINNKEYGLQWGMGAIELYCDAMNCDIDGIDMVTTVCREQPKAIVTLILSALRNYAELHNQTLDVSYRQLQVWLDESEQKTFNEIMENFKNSKYFGKTIAEYLFGQVADPTPSLKKKSRSVKS